MERQSAFSTSFQCGNQDLPWASLPYTSCAGRPTYQLHGWLVLVRSRSIKDWGTQKKKWWVRTSEYGSSSDRFCALLGLPILRKWMKSKRVQNLSYVCHQHLHSMARYFGLQWKKAQKKGPSKGFLNNLTNVPRFETDSYNLGPQTKLGRKDSIEAKLCGSGV